VVNKPTINNVVILPSVPGGPWKTKAGGILVAPINLTSDQSQCFLQIPPAELADNPKLHPGLRVYFQWGLKPGSLGGGEFHRGRQEMIIVITGLVSWEAEDLDGKKKNILLKPGMAILVPPYIMHSYFVLEDAILEAITNTGFDPEGGEQGKDTYSLKEFRTLQTQGR